MNTGRVDYDSPVLGRNGIMALERRVRLIIGLFVWLCLVVPSAKPQAENVLARDSDERAITTKEKQAAVAALSESIGQAREVGDYRRAAKFLNRVGRLQLRLNLISDALATYAESEALLQRTPDPILEVDELNGRTAVLAHLNRCDEAQLALDRSESLAGQHQYAAGLAETLLIRCDCQRQTDHAEALATAKRSLALWQSIGRKWGIAKAYQAIGDYELSLSNLSEATENFTTALSLWNELDLPNEQAEALISLGFVEYRKGAWENAFTQFDRAAALLDEESEPYKLAQITGTTAEALIESGLPENAQPLLERSADYFRRAEDKDGQAVIAWDLGRSYYYTGEYAQALNQLNNALVTAREIKDLVLVARCEDFLGRTYVALGDSENALAHYDVAGAQFGRSHDRLEVARINALKGQVYETQGKTELARNQYLGALSTFNSLTDQINQSATLFALGKLEFDQGRLDLAETYLQRSIQVTENLRRVSQSTDLTAAFSATVNDRYEKYVECLMRKYRERDISDLEIRAFEASELARGRSLAELLLATGTRLVPGLDSALAEREKNLRQLLRAKADQQVQLLGSDSYRKEELEQLRTDQTKLENEYHEVTQTIRERYPAFGAITQPATLSLAQIQDQVIADEETVLLEYSLGDDKSFVWVVSKSGFDSVELPGRKEINEAAAAVYRLESERPKADTDDKLADARQALSKRILFPVADKLTQRRVIVVADGVLNYISFQSLPDPAAADQPMVAQHEIVNSPSASILAELRQESAARPQAAKVLAAFGDAVFPSNYRQTNATTGNEYQGTKLDNDRLNRATRDIEINGDKLDFSNIEPLIYAKTELQNLSELAGSNSLVASQYAASRDNLLQTDLTKYSILHFATHGVLDPKHPENSGLVLSLVDRQMKSQNGFVGLQDIYSLRAPVSLVVLSACRTGLGKDVKGEGLIGLTRGFMYAGASTVVASLWKVDDEATSELMKEFYTNLLERGMPPAEALRAAQNTIRSKPQWSSPYFWAAFTVQGEYRNAIRPARVPGTQGLAKRLGITFTILAAFAGLAYTTRRRMAVHS